MIFNSNLKDLSKFRAIARQNGKLMNHQLFELFKNFPSDLQIPQEIRDFHKEKIQFLTRITMTPHYLIQTLARWCMET